VNNAPTNILDDLRLLQAPQPLTWSEWLLLALGAAAMAGFILWRRARARRAGRPPEAVIQAARIDALAELEKLRGMIAAPNSRPYAIAVSGVVRHYIERRFALRAPWRSTEEFLAEALKSPVLDSRHQQNLAQFLAGCDFLKFARATAEVPELTTLHQAAVQFVTDTQPAPAVQA
jgi:hypothetical protein